MLIQPKEECHMYATKNEQKNRVPVVTKLVLNEINYSSKLKEI